MQPAGQNLRKAVAEVHDHWRLIEARAALAKAQQPGAREAEEESLRGTIASAAENRDWRLIMGIGSRAQPFLAAMVLEQPDDFPSVGDDPLVYMIDLGAHGAAALLLENLHAGGHLWESRIIRAMDNRSVLESSKAWARASPSDDRQVCLEPEWLRILEELLRSPETAPESFSARA